MFLYKIVFVSLSSFNVYTTTLGECALLWYLERKMVKETLIAICFNQNIKLRYLLVTVFDSSNKGHLLLLFFHKEAI